MNEKNVEYLSRDLKYLGFGDQLNGELEKAIAKGEKQFTLNLSTEINSRPFEASLHFRKGEQAEHYFFNRWDGALQKGEESLQQSFYVSKGHGVTLKEGFNLLEGRAVHKELTNHEGERYQAWLQLDFSARDTNGNYKVQQYHQNYGFDLEKTLSALPIKELGDPSQKDMLLRSLQKGNVQAVTMEGQGVVEKLLIEAVPRFKSVNIYDQNGGRIPVQRVAERLGLSEGKNKDVKQETVMQQQQAPTAEQSVGKGKKKEGPEVTLIGPAKQSKPSKGKKPSF